MRSIAWLLTLLGLVVLLIAAIGVLRLPDALSRQHAATKAATLSISLFVFALMSYALASGGNWDWIARLLLLLTTLLLTLPLAAHTLIRSALSEQNSESDQ